MTDLAKTKQQLIVEETLRQSERRLRRIYESGLLGVIYWDMDGRISDANDTFLEMVGYPREDLVAGRINWVKMTPPEFRHLDDRAVEELKNAGVKKAPFEKEYIRKDGTRVPILLSGAMLDEARHQGVAFVFDITQRKRAETELQQARDELERRVAERTAELAKANVQLQREVEERRQAEDALRDSQSQLQQSHDELLAIYDCVMDGIIVVDAETGRPVQANPAYRRMLDYIPEEVKTLTVDRVHPPEVVPAVREHCRAAKNGAIARIDELPFLRKDGVVVYADAVSGPICYNQRPCWISFFHDVTERRQARIALERERHALEHMLKASDHERQLIAYDIHDGLTQELTAAIMQFQICEEFKDSSPDGAATAYDRGVNLLGRAHAEARRLISGVRPPILDESGVVAAVAHLVHELGFNPGAKIDFRSRVTFGRLDPAEENAIYRIVQESLNNARNHSKSNKIVVSLIQHGKRLRIEVRDWGVGFDLNAVQGDHFGLEGIRQRARLLGGTCSLMSEPGKGTQIVVELPVTPSTGSQELGVRS